MQYWPPGLTHLMSSTALTLGLWEWSQTAEWTSPYV